MILNTPDLSGVVNVSTAAELSRDIAHACTTLTMSPYFSPNRAIAPLSCVPPAIGSSSATTGMTFQDHFVDQSLCLCNLLSGHSGEVAEVETAAVLIVVRTCLMNVGTQYLTQSQLEQMTYRVVGHDAAAALCVNLSGNGVSSAEAAFGDSTNMHEVTFVVFLGILDGEYIVPILRSRRCRRPDHQILRRRRSC